MLYYRVPAVKKLKHLNTHFIPGFSKKYFSGILFKNNSGKIITSSYLNDLLEKQKIKYAFLLKERCLKKYLFYKKKYIKSNGFQLVNVRLDVILFRLGYFQTIKQARQCITHGHILVNYIVVMKPSCIVYKGAVISVSPLSFSIIRKCRRNIMEQNVIYRYYKSILFCPKTLTSFILALPEFWWPVSYDLAALIRYYYV